MPFISIHLFLPYSHGILPSHFIFTLMHSVPLPSSPSAPFTSPSALSPFIFLYSPGAFYFTRNPLFHTFTFSPLMYFISPLGTICTFHSSPELLIFLLTFVLYSLRFPLFYSSLFSLLQLSLALSAPFVFHLNICISFSSLVPCILLRNPLFPFHILLSPHAFLP